MEGRKKKLWLKEERKKKMEKNRVRTAFTNLS